MSSETNKKSSTSKASAAKEPTRVLLVVVNNRKNHIITHDKYFKAFSAFGEVQRVSSRKIVLTPRSSFSTAQ